MSQSGALMVTGSIWTRWCFVITPKNYALAAINASVGIGGGYQFFRVRSSAFFCTTRSRLTLHRHTCGTRTTQRR